MAKLFILLLIVAAVSAEYTIEDAANYADANDDDVISGVEFTTWYAAVVEYKYDSIRAEFSPAEGPIPVADFETTLQELVNEATEAGAPEPEYTVQQASAHFDENEDDEIEDDEFQAWYDTAMAELGKLMKSAMKGNDDVITKAEFISVLEYAEAQS